MTNAWPNQTWATGYISRLSKWSIIISLVVAIAIQIVGCTSREAPSLRLGTNIWPGYEPLYLAAELGYYPDSTVELVEFLSASEVIRAFRNNSIEAAALTLDESLILLEHQIPIQVVLVTDISDGGDGILAKPGLGDVGDLVGRRIGVEGNALGAYVLSRAMDMHGIALESIDVVQLEVSHQEAAYLDDSVDAIVTFEPVRSRVLAAGANEIFSSRDIPGEIVDAIVVREAYVREHPGQIAALANGWFRALDYLANHPDDAATRMSNRLGLTPQQVLDSYKGIALATREENEALLGGQEPQLLKTVERLQAVMMEKELLTGPVAIDSLLTPTALQIANQ